MPAATGARSCASYHIIIFLPSSVHATGAASTTAGAAFCHHCHYLYTRITTNSRRNTGACHLLPLCHAYTCLYIATNMAFLLTLYINIILLIVLSSLECRRLHACPHC